MQGIQGVPPVDSRVTSRLDKECYAVSSHPLAFNHEIQLC